MPTGCLPDAENVKFSKYIVEESRHMGDCSEVETLHLTKWSFEGLEDKWICRLGSFYQPAGLNTRDEIKSRVRVNFRDLGRHWYVRNSMFMCMLIYTLSVSFFHLSYTSMYAIYSRHGLICCIVCKPCNSLEVSLWDMCAINFCMSSQSIMPEEGW